MRRFKIFHGPLQFAQKSVGVFRFFLGVNRLLGRSLHETSYALSIVVMRLRNLGDGWLKLRQQIEQLGFPISRNVFGRLNSRFGLLNVLVSHLWPSLLPFMISLSDLLTRWNGTRLETTCDFRNFPDRLQAERISASILQPFKLSASVSDAEFLLRSLFRFCSQRESTGQGIEDFRVPERPSIINRHSVEAPLVAIAHQVAIVAIHQ